MDCPGCKSEHSISTVRHADGGTYCFPCLNCGKVPRRSPKGGFSFLVVKECATVGCDGSSRRSYEYGENGEYESSSRSGCGRCYGGGSGTRP